MVRSLPFGGWLGAAALRVRAWLLRNPMRIVGSAGGSAVLTVCMSLVLGAVSAFGATGHDFVSSMNEAPVGAMLHEPSAVAVDGARGEVFVADRSAGVVDVFSAEGMFLTQFGEGMLTPAGVAVSEATGLVYVADSVADAVLVFKPDGAGGYRLLAKWFGEGVQGEEFGRVSGVAVDNSESASAGDVYVVDARDRTLDEGAVDVFKPRPAGSEEGREGVLVHQLTAGALQQPNGIAVGGSSGRVLVADSF